MIFGVLKEIKEGKNRVALTQAKLPDKYHDVDEVMSDLTSY